jgi:SAM-dependent methyltransferase
MRTESFDSTRGSILDQLIWWLRVRKVSRQLPSSVGKAADLGCGRSAPLLRHLVNSGVVTHGVGVDLAPDQSFAQSEPGRQLTLVQGDLNEQLSIASESVDVVLSLAVIEHLTAPGLHLKEAYRILKPGGVLLLTTPSPKGKPVLEFLAFRLGVIDRREIEDHKIYFDGNMLRELLQLAGFKSEALKVTTFQIGLNNSVFATR